ncbi:MAG TPA: hypothetical protein VEI05_01570 [Burkholderiaceae bacterium]|nr:hypothetical protein [Burkholderiaceae bacterium]
MPHAHIGRMWIGLISDVHAEDKRLELALAHLASSGVEAVFFLGDAVAGPSNA